MKAIRGSPQKVDLSQLKKLPQETDMEIKTQLEEVISEEIKKTTPALSPDRLIHPHAGSRLEAQDGMPSQQCQGINTSGRSEQ